LRLGEYLVVGGTLGASFVLTMFVRQAAGSTGLVDVPNERSSHAVPTPRGGGLAIVIASILAVGLLTLVRIIPLHLSVALCGGGVAVAAIGLLDDRGPMPVGVRLLVHFLAAIWAVAWVGQVSAVQIEGEVIQLGTWGYVLSVIAVVWFLNIFNFMDGIDGIAATEAIFICIGAVLLSEQSKRAGAIAAAASVTGAASAGFLIWNWPPAKIFMGDVGSGYLGFAIAVIALAGAKGGPAGPWMPLILAGVFIADSTVTLVRRFMQGDAISVAHRTHAYQRAARRLGHAKVTTMVVVVNLAWLLPCAAATTLWPIHAWWIAVLALAPLLTTAVVLGAGRREVPL
jgi:glycosyltransferase WbpL